MRVNRRKENVMRSRKECGEGQFEDDACHRPRAAAPRTQERAGQARVEAGVRTPLYDAADENI